MLFNLKTSLGVLATSVVVNAAPRAEGGWGGDGWPDWSNGWDEGKSVYYSKLQTTYSTSKSIKTTTATSLILKTTTSTILNTVVSIKYTTIASTSTSLTTDSTEVHYMTSSVKTITFYSTKSA